MKKKANELLKEARESAEDANRRAEHWGLDDDGVVMNQETAARLYKKLDDHILKTGELPSEWSSAVFKNRYTFEETETDLGGALGTSGDPIWTCTECGSHRPVHNCPE